MKSYFARIYINRSFICNWKSVRPIYFLIPNPLRISSVGNLVVFSVGRPKSAINKNLSKMFSIGGEVNRLYLFSQHYSTLIFPLCFSFSGSVVESYTYFMFPKFKDVTFFQSVFRVFWAIFFIFRLSAITLVGINHVKNRVIC